jgi:hypothetical protein
MVLFQQEGQMPLDKATYYRQRVQQLREDAALQKQTIADLEQRLFMIEAELSAFEAALDLETPQDETVPAEALIPQEEFSASDSASATAQGRVSHSVFPLEKNARFFVSDTGVVSVSGRASREEPPTYAATLRSILGQSNCGMTPTDILKEFANRDQAIKPEYLYALLSRLRSRGELKRRSKKYSINENRPIGISR